MPTDDGGPVGGEGGADGIETCDGAGDDSDSEAEPASCACLRDHAGSRGRRRAVFLGFWTNCDSGDGAWDRRKRSAESSSGMLSKAAVVNSGDAGALGFESEDVLRLGGPGRKVGSSFAEEGFGAGLVARRRRVTAVLGGEYRFFRVATIFTVFASVEWSWLLFRPKVMRDRRRR